MIGAIARKGNVTARVIEVKRDIMGTYHHVTKKYLPLYVNEFTFRHNRRNAPNRFRAVLAGC